MAQSLDQLEIGQKCRVLKVNSSGKMRKALLEMGILPNTEMEVIRSAPLGDPLAYLVRGYHLSIRKQDASKVDVEVISN